MSIRSILLLRFVLIGFSLNCTWVAAQDLSTTFQPLIEEFCGGYMPKGSDVAVANIPKWGVGDLNWAWSLTNTTGSTFGRPNQVDVNHPCVITATTGNVLGNEATLRLCPQNLQATTPCNDNTAHQSIAGLNSLKFDTYIIFKLPSVSGINVQAGFMDESDENKAELTFEYNTDLDSSPSRFKLETNNSSDGCATNCLRTDLGTFNGAGPTANVWVKVHIYSTTPGTIRVAWCQGTTSTGGCTLGTDAATISGTSVPAGPMSPALHMQTRAAANKSVTWDYFYFTINSAVSR